MPSYSFKKITDYKPDELDEAIMAAVEHCSGFSSNDHEGHKHTLDFYKILNGIDAYLERRTRKAQSDYFRKHGTQPGGKHGV